MSGGLRRLPRVTTRRAAITLAAAGLLAVGGVGLVGCGGSDVENVVSEGVGGAESVGESIGEGTEDLADDVADGAKDGAEAND